MGRSGANNLLGHICSFFLLPIIWPVFEIFLKCIFNVYVKRQYVENTNFQWKTERLHLCVEI